MARQEKRRKTFLYKRANCSQPGFSLGVALLRAWNKLRSVRERRESLAPDDESPVWRVIALAQPEDEVFSGLLIRYTPGHHPLFVTDDETARTLPMRQLAAPADGQRNRELVEATVHFSVWQNHLVIVQSLGLNSFHLEDHLRFLLREAGEFLPDQTLQLVDDVPAAVAKLLETRPIKEIEISAGLEAPADEGAVAPVDGGLHDFLRSFFAPARAADLNLGALLGANMQYALRLKYQGRETTLNGQKLLNQLAAAMRHAEGVHVVLHLKGGGIIKGKQLRLEAPISVPVHNGVPQPGVLFEMMKSWLLQTLRNGQLAP